MLSDIITTVGAMYNKHLPNNIESRLNFFQYNSLESILNPLQASEPEDPPETMHTPWGIWRHYRDALHSIDERFDAEHVIRKGYAAEDILHQAHYVPVIGEDGHIKKQSYEMNLEYIYSSELDVYNSKINLKEYHSGIDFEERMGEESLKISINTETEDKSIDSKSKDVDEDPKEIPHKNKIMKNKVNLELEEELTKIFEKILGKSFTVKV